MQPIPDRQFQGEFQVNRTLVCLALPLQPIAGQSKRGSVHVGENRRHDSHLFRQNWLFPKPSPGIL